MTCAVGVFAQAATASLACGSKEKTFFCFGFGSFAAKPKANRLFAGRAEEPFQFV
jgi:hypothetical protein